MANWLERIAAGLAALHADRVLAGFMKAIRAPRVAQQRALRRALRVVAGGAYGRRYGLERVRTPAELRRAVPLQRYDQLADMIEQVAGGDHTAMLAPDQRLLMFATSSGTTSRPKLIPVTDAFIQDYRRGWNVFGLKVLRDHPDAILRGILQVTGRYDERRSAAGVPIGAITGLLARAQKSIVRRFYVAGPEIAEIPDPRDRYYALARVGIERDVAFAVTANPATLIRIAKIADEESERLIRDVRDGTLTAASLPPGAVRRALTTRMRPNPARAGELAQLRASRGRLRPADYWRLSFLACWIGGSMGQYRDGLGEWYGPLPVRDLGLLASEGRVTIPLEDNRACGVLDVSAGCFEFIAAADFDQADPGTMFADELEIGRDYAVVLTNTTGLVRYRLDDVVHVVDRIGGAPVLEFKYRGGRVSSVAGEKLTEDQAVTAVTKMRQHVGLPAFDFLLAPVWGDPPYYRLTTSAPIPAPAATHLDAALSEANSEYSARRSSGRLGPPTLRALGGNAIAMLDARLVARRGAAAEQYKRQVLYCRPGEDDEALELTG